MYNKVGSVLKVMDSLSVKNSKSVVLVGMMGSGKSSVGPIVAERLGLSYFDSDQNIEEEQGRSVSDIFAKDGERAFRVLEEQAIEALLGEAQCVISTGGGAVTSASTRALIEEKAVGVWLNASSTEILKRIGDDTCRPLLQVDDPKAVLDRLISERDAFYRGVDIHVETAGKSAQDVADEILGKLGAL